MRYDDNAVLRQGRSLKYSFGSVELNGMRNPRLESGRRRCPKRRSGVVSGLDSVSRFSKSQVVWYLI